MRAARLARVWGKGLISAICAGLFAAFGFAQAARPHAPATVPALLVSDIHFEPFWDTAKTAELAAVPVEQWDDILAAPPSSDREQRLAALQQACHSRGADTSPALLSSSLQAMREQAADARFITVSGDLISHNFECKFAKTLPKAAPADYQAFVVKTIAYVQAELRKSFPGVPVYTALGNNDSGCADYRLDAHSEFLAETGKLTIPGVASTRSGGFAAEGDYSAPLPAPIHHARLLVLDNLFQSKRYATCSGKPDPQAAAAQIAWLRGELAAARKRHEKVWVMAHIPPGIDPYATARKLANVCAGDEPEMFLANDALADALAEFGDVVSLAIFAHTHMDEMRLIEPARAGAAHPAVAVKMVGSISPVNGNNPSFTVASVDPVTARLADYRVFTASNQPGDSAAWAEEYDFAQTYHEPAFTPAALADLFAGFRADPGADAAASQSYLRNYYSADRPEALKPFWPQYACVLQNYTV